ncbi:hypothetical protein Btru_019839 [Bulinus truncatus]|nr:hypothetical protein Btru_019839 [Bulinus truncatus]
MTMTETMEHKKTQDGEEENKETDGEYSVTFDKDGTSQGTSIDETEDSDVYEDSGTDDQDGVVNNETTEEENDQTAVGVSNATQEGDEKENQEAGSDAFLVAGNTAPTMMSSIEVVISHDEVSGDGKVLESDVDTPRMTRNFSQNLSESSDYDYRDGTLAPDIDSDSLADSWDWTFPNSNVSELDIPAEQKFNMWSRGRQRLKRGRRDPIRQEVSVGTQTDESSNLAGFKSNTEATNQNITQDYRKNIEITQEPSVKRKNKRKKVKKAAFDEDVVYFEDPSSSRVFKTKLLYLYTDSNVRLKSSSAWSEIGNHRGNTNKLKENVQKTVKEFEQRNVKRILSKLPNIESKFIRPRLKADGDNADTANVGAEFGPERENTVSPSPLSKSSHMPLNSSLKLNNSTPDSHALFGDTITDRLMSWRLARGRSMSKPDVYRKSMTKEELQKDIFDFLESVKEKQSALERFRHTARLILLMLRAIGFKPQKPEENRYNFLSWTVVYDEVLGISRLNYDSGTLTFDPLLYKANKETTVSQDVKDILKLPANQRTQAHVHTVRINFKQVAPSFSEFPIRIQESMIKVCTYEKFEAGRVIIRQGHRAENFYFILSGCAVVTEMDNYANHAHTTNVLGKGNSFGELALLNMSLRSATVTCREDVELIWIERQDFIDIFMRRVVGKEADHITFLKTVELLQGWPVDKLPPQNPKICAFTYVRRGVVLCHDSSKSDWIYVIVSGSCKILKALDDVPLNKQQKADIANEKSQTLPTISIASPDANFASIYTISNNNEQDDGAASRSNNLSNSRARRQGTVQRPDLVIESMNLLRNQSEASVSISQSQHQSELDSLFLKRHVLPSLQDNKAQKDSYVENITGHNPRKVSIQTLQLSPPVPLFQPKRQSYGLNPPVLPQLVNSSAPRLSTVPKVFIDVARLDTGQVFGLDQVVLSSVRKVTSYSLVSDGAEVVLINKKYFKKHLTEETLKIMRKKISPLPSEKVLQKNLETLKTWEAYKAVTLSRYASWRQKLADVPEFSR